MKTFPDKLNVSCKKNFRIYHCERVTCYLRKDLYELIITEDENNYFEIDKFKQYYKLSTHEINTMVNLIISELEKLGWTCKITFGGSALFVYSDIVPTSYYPDGF